MSLVSFAILYILPHAYTHIDPSEREPQDSAKYPNSPRKKLVQASCICPGRISGEGMWVSKEQADTEKGMCVEKD